MTESVSVARSASGTCAMRKSQVGRSPVGRSQVATGAGLVVAFGAALIVISPPAAYAVGFDVVATPASNTVATVAPTASDRWMWPVPAPIQVVAPFRAPPTPYKAGHRGIDLLVAPAATITAPAPGTVSFAGMVAGRGVVAIDHGNGVVSAIEPVAASVAKGDVVSAGDVIGVAAQGGHCTGDCVHFGVRVHGEYVSPFLFLGGLPRAVLLPLD